MNAIEYLVNEHANHNALFERLRDGDISVMPELRAAIIRHVRMEEKFLFTPALAKTELEENSRFAWEEHNLIMDLLQKIDEQVVSSDEWFSKIRLLEKIHQVHIKEEEEIFFPLLAATYTEDELATMGSRMWEYRHEETPDEILYPEVPGSHQI